MSPSARRSLDRLLGATRSRILAALTTPLQTTVVARLVSVTTPTASEHLAILRDAGLIDSSRAGRISVTASAPELPNVCCRGRACLNSSGTVVPMPRLFWQCLDLTGRRHGPPDAACSLNTTFATSEIDTISEGHPQV
ncbi:ArsR/SmtB family transcription factor [Nonomuraea cypriaca]|uniref:ArsR/SmtB family transcription factor n=1 Tax=Nonomuraea cypriaca TaxID=1187855 RepID=UPI001A9C6885